MDGFLLHAGEVPADPDELSPSGAHDWGPTSSIPLGTVAGARSGDKGGSAFGAYVLGLAFAFGWTPCIGPQLGAILSLAATEARSMPPPLSRSLPAVALRSG